MKAVNRLIVGAVALAAASGSAWAQTTPPPGRIYVFHSTAQGGCPALDWHIVTGVNGALSGMIAWDDMKAMAKATGSVSAGKVQMTATEVGGQGRTATVNGTVGSNGWFTVNITGPKVSCQGISVPFFVPAAGGNG
jgi:hypothetical protein